MISEVATSSSPENSAWFEVYNSSDVPIDLSTYQLRTGSTTTDPATPTLFTLPSLVVPARGQVVVAGKVLTTSWSHDNAQIVYIASEKGSPYWQDSGFVELIKKGATADFVRFGDSKIEPVTPGKWTSANVAALPTGELEYGRSIVRPMRGNTLVAPNRYSAADWVLVNFSTPAGINDVAAGVIDSDEDGIPDSAKVPGGTYGGLDFYSMGARPGKRDIFMQIDYMKEPEGRTEPALKPRKEALQKVVDAFANSPTTGKPYALHIDVGSLYSPEFSPANFNLGGGKEVDFRRCIAVPSSFDLASTIVAPGCATLFDYKSTGFDTRRRMAFHYVVFGNSQEADGSAGSSGIAELHGSDFVVTLGSVSNAGGTSFYSTDPGPNLWKLINVQASTLMHEFGHNLGLFHGGFEHVNYKPNYVSIMNYLHQMTGIGASQSDPTATDRYMLEYAPSKFNRCTPVTGNAPGVTTITNSPCTADFKLDYSNGSSAPLDEASLNEAFNIGRGSVNGAYADWNLNGQLDTVFYSHPLNLADPGRASGPVVMRDFNDWDNLMLPFARYFSGSQNGRSKASSARSKRTAHPRSVIVEEVPYRLIEELKREKRERAEAPQR